MLEAYAQYWAKRGFDLQFEITKDDHQFLIHFHMYVQKTGVSRAAAVPGVDWFGFRVKMKNPPIPTMDEILEGHHVLLKHFPEGVPQ